jgi:hypothetical protein
VNLCPKSFGAAVDSEDKTNGVEIQLQNRQSILFEAELKIEVDTRFHERDETKAGARLKLKLSEQSYRTSLLQMLNDSLKGKGYLVIEEGSYNAPNDRAIKIPDIVIARQKMVVQSSDEIFVLKGGVSAIVETKKPKRESTEGFGQAAQYAFQLGAPLGFTTNFKDIVSFSMGGIILNSAGKSSEKKPMNKPREKLRIT